MGSGPSKPKGEDNVSQAVARKADQYSLDPFRIKRGGAKKAAPKKAAPKKTTSGKKKPSKK